MVSQTHDMQNKVLLLLLWCNLVVVWYEYECVSCHVHR